MGVTALWDILEPVGRPCEINAQEAKSLAVDLSGWVCDSCSVTAMKSVVTNPHLRNLYYRASCLKLSGIDTIFVIEGKAPTFKSSTIMNRCKPTNNHILHPNNGNVQRKNFQIKLGECRKLLETLGIQCVKAYGEAEAMCAFLNEQSVVDGCITNDSDAFLYGAKKVYKNFSMDNKVPKAVCYSMSDIQAKLGLDREKLVALALLIGCDYTQGVPGIGKIKAMAFVQRFSNGKEILKRFQEWQEMPDCRRNALQDYPENDVIKNQAMKVIGFPSQEIIQEFLVSKDKKPAAILQWTQPDLSTLNDFCKTKLDWPHEATEKSSLQIYTRWQLEETIKNGHNDTFLFHATRIVKLQKRQSYVQVEWTRKDKLDPFVTSEPVHMIRAALPQLYSTIQVLPKKNKTKKSSDKNKLLQTKISDFNLGSASTSAGKSCTVVKNFNLDREADKIKDVIVIDDSSSDDEFDKMLQALKKFSVAVSNDCEKTVSATEEDIPTLSPIISKVSTTDNESGHAALNISVNDRPKCLADRVKRQLNGNPDLEATLKAITGFKL